MNKINIKLAKMHQKMAKDWFEESLNESNRPFMTNLLRKHAEYHYCSARRLMGIQ